jgi:hypothetical protein
MRFEFVLACAGVMAGAAAAAAQPTWPAANPAEAEQRLRESLVVELGRRDVAVTTEGADSLTALVQAVSADLQKQGASRTQIVREEARIVDEVARAARVEARGQTDDAEGPDEPVVSEETVEEAFERRCRRRYPRPPRCPP